MCYVTFSIFSYSVDFNRPPPPLLEEDPVRRMKKSKTVVNENTFHWAPKNQLHTAKITLPQLYLFIHIILFLFLSPDGLLLYGGVGWGGVGWYKNALPQWYLNSLKTK